MEIIALGVNIQILHPPSCSPPPYTSICGSCRLQWGNKGRPPCGKPVTGNGNKSRRGHVLCNFISSGLELSALICSCSTLPSPPNSPHPNTVLSHPHLEWCICMEMTGPALPSRRVSITFFLFFWEEGWRQRYLYLFIWNPCPLCAGLSNVREREGERGELCYLSGELLVGLCRCDWSLLQQNLLPSERLAALRWRGKVDFFFAHCLHSYLNLLFSPHQFASQYLSHLIHLSFIFASSSFLP